MVVFDPPLGRVLLVTDSHHLPRLLPAARLAIGGGGLAVASLPADAAVPPPSAIPPGPWPVIRDWLRLQLWRATGSIGAFLAPATRQRKAQECF